MKYKYYVFLVTFLLFFVGCNNVDKVNVTIYGLDTNKVIHRIDEDGKYVDSCGIEFNSYISNNHFEIYYNNLNDKNKDNVNNLLIELEQAYPKVINFLDLDDGKLPVIKIYMYDEIENLYNSFESETINNYEDCTSKYVRSNSIYAIYDSNSIIYSFVDCVILNIAQEKHVPIWLLEGISTYILEDINENNWRYAEYLELEDLSISDLNSDINVEYELAYSLVSTIIDNYGKEALKQLVLSYGDIEEIDKLNERDLLEKWKIYLQKNSVDNIHGYDYTDIIGIIEKDDKYYDEAGNLFNDYIKSEHFELYYNNTLYKSNEKANNTVEALEDVYHEILDTFKVSEENMPVVKINMYNSDKAYNDQIKALGKNVYNSKGYTKNTNRFYFVYHEDRDIPWWKIFSTHEFVHTVNFYATPKKVINAWFTEGIAMYISQDQDYFGQYCYDELIKTGFGSYEKLCIKGDMSYKYGYSMVEYILTNYGQEQLIKLIYEYGNIEKALNISIEEFEVGWLNFLKKKID